MKRARITYLIALPAAVLVLAGAAYATASANTGTGRSAADQVRTAERTLLRAAVDADTHTAGRLLAPGFQLIDVTGTANTRADYLATIGGDRLWRLPATNVSARGSRKSGCRLRTWPGSGSVGQGADGRRS